MYLLSPVDVAAAVRALFDPSAPAGIRILAVLEGNMPGRLFVDDSANPTCAVLQETVYGTIYPTDAVSASVLAELIAELRRESELMIGLWPDAPRIPDLLDLQPEYDGHVYDFFDRSIGQGLDTYLTPIPDGCELRTVDADLYKRLEDYDPRNAEQALANGIGLCLMRGDEILCEAFAGLLTQHVMEMGVATHKPHEGKGYATLTCAHLVHVCEERGFQTYWNCNTQNVASVKIARKLGYRTKKEYRLLYWSKLM